MQLTQILFQHGFKVTIIADKIDAAINLFIPITVVGELYYGAQYSTKVEQKLNNIS